MQSGGMLAENRFKPMFLNASVYSSLPPPRLHQSFDKDMHCLFLFRAVPSTASIATFCLCAFALTTRPAELVAPSCQQPRPEL